MSAHVSPLDLDRRLSRRIETGKGVRLEPEELDLLVRSGAIDVFRNYASEYQRGLCRDRDLRNRSISGDATNSTSDQIAPTTTSSGMTQQLVDSAAEARAREHWTPRKKPSIGSISNRNEGKPSARPATGHGTKSAASRSCKP